MVDVVAPPGAQPTRHWSEATRWRHPAWGILLGFMFTVADVALNPGEDGLAMKHKLMLMLAVAAFAVVTVFTFTEVRRRWEVTLVAGVLAFIAAAVSGDWAGGDATMPGRDVVVPSAALAAGIVAIIAWKRLHSQGAQVLMVAAVVAIGMTGYGQQSPEAWAVVAGVVGTWLFLIARIGVFARYTGLAIHALALLAMVQQQPGWFTWAAYPFLTLMPIYLLAMVFIERGRSRIAAWGIGAGMGTLLLLLGISTAIGRSRDGLPIQESTIMIGLGTGIVAIFGLLYFLGRRAPTLLPVADGPST